MTLNKTETKKMLKVKAVLEDIFDNGKLGKYKVVPYTAREIAMCYNELVRNVRHSTETICFDVKVFFESRGFLVVEKEIDNGWDIYISERMKKIMCK